MGRRKLSKNGSSVYYLFYTTKLIPHTTIYINHQKWWDKKEQPLAGTCLTLWSSEEWNVELIHTITHKASVQTWYNTPLPRPKSTEWLGRIINIMQCSDTGESDWRATQKINLNDYCLINTNTPPKIWNV